MSEIRENNQKTVYINDRRIPECPTCKKGTEREKTRYSKVDFTAGTTTTRWRCLECDTIWDVIE